MKIPNISLCMLSWLLILGGCEKLKEEKVLYRTDEAPILKRVKGLPAIIAVKWIGEATGKDSLLSPPRSSAYRMRGYVKVSILDLENFIAKGEWREADPPLVPGFSFSEGKDERFRWYYSKAFNESAIASLVYGKIYICPRAGLIYFDLHGE